MAENQESERNSAAYQRMKDTIDHTYPKGWFVGIADDQIVGAAASFTELEQQLRGKGRDPRRVFVVEAGVAYPDYVTILA